MFFSSNCPKLRIFSARFPLNVRYSDGCVNDISPQCTLQLTTEPSAITPVTHVQLTGICHAVRLQFCYTQ